MDTTTTLVRIREALEQPCPMITHDIGQDIADQYMNKEDEIFNLLQKYCKKIGDSGRGAPATVNYLDRHTGHDRSANYSRPFNRNDDQGRAPQGKGGKYTSNPKSGVGGKGKGGNRHLMRHHNSEHQDHHQPQGRSLQDLRAALDRANRPRGHHSDTGPAPRSQGRIGLVTDIPALSAAQITDILDAANFPQVTEPSDQTELRSSIEFPINMAQSDRQGPDLNKKKPVKTKPRAAVSFFDGIGGCALGLQDANLIEDYGIDVVLAIEIDPIMRTISANAHKENGSFKGVFHIWHDVNSITKKMVNQICDEYEIVFMTAGWPCTDISPLRDVDSKTGKKFKNPHRTGLQGSKRAEASGSQGLTMDDADRPWEFAAPLTWLRDRKPGKPEENKANTCLLIEICSKP